jgi:hypothetical protein
MQPAKNPSFAWSLLIGDAVVLASVTLYGFALHGTLGSSGSRPLTTFVPFLIAWLLLAPHLDVFNRQTASQWRSLWRPVYAMVLAAPFAGFLRALWLDANIAPIFVVIMGGVSGIAILLWRAGYWAVNHKKQPGER